MEKLYAFITLVIIYIPIIFLIKRCKKKVIKVIFIALAITFSPVSIPLILAIYST